MDFHKFDGLVKRSDHLFVIGHAVKRVGNEYRIDAGVRHDTDGPAFNGIFDRGLCLGGFALAVFALTRNARIAECGNGRHARRTAAVRNGATAHGLAHHHAAQNRGNTRHRHRPIHRVERDVVRPRVLDRENPHDDFFALKGQMRVRGRTDRVHVAGRTPENEHVAALVRAHGQLPRNEPRPCERCKHVRARALRDRQKFLTHVGEPIDVQDVPQNVPTEPVGFAHGAQKRFGRDARETSRDRSFNGVVDVKEEPLGAGKARKYGLHIAAVGIVREGLRHGLGRHGPGKDLGSRRRRVALRLGLPYVKRLEGRGPVEAEREKEDRDRTGRIRRGSGLESEIEDPSYERREKKRGRHGSRVLKRECRPERGGHWNRTHSSNRKIRRSRKN